MEEPINYNLQHAHGMVDLVLTDDRLIVNTQGAGLIDKLRTIDIPLASLGTSVWWTIGAQSIISRNGGEGGNFLYDRSCDAEFIFSYQADRELEKKRVFINSDDDVFQSLLEELVSKRPDASLLHLEPADAQKQIGVHGRAQGCVHHHWPTGRLAYCHSYDRDHHPAWPVRPPSACRQCLSCITRCELGRLGPSSRSRRHAGSFSTSAQPRGSRAAS